MSIIKHTTDTVSSVLGAVSTTATAVDRTIGSAASSIDMLAAFISKAKHKQAIDHKLELANYTTSALLESSAAQQRTEEAILREMSADPVRKSHFDEIHARLAAVLAA